MGARISALGPRAIKTAKTPQVKLGLKASLKNQIKPKQKVPDFAPTFGFPKSFSLRQVKKKAGMHKCNKIKCSVCDFVKVGSQVSATATKAKIDISRPVDCQTRNIVYCVTCKKCGEQYIGETEKSLQERTRQHLRHITNKKINHALGDHFNKPGHSISDFQITVLLKIAKNDMRMRTRKEKDLITLFDTKDNGINRKQGGVSKKSKRFTAKQEKMVFAFAIHLALLAYYYLHLKYS